MTDWTPQNNRIQTKHLTADELAALKAAKWGWFLVEVDSSLSDLTISPSWVGYLVYRAKPAPVTQDVVPWEAIADGWNWFARDADGEGFLYAEKPRPYDASGEFVAPVDASSFCNTDHIFAITPGTCDWRDSLQQRPVTVGAEPERFSAVINPQGPTSAWMSMEKEADGGWVRYADYADAVAAAKSMCAKGGV